MLLYKIFITIAIIGLIVPAIAQTPIKIMPLGDSITEWGCWRAYLWNKLQQRGIENIDFVGSVTSTTTCNVSDWDRDNEGHAGYLAIDIANNNQLVGWLSSANPDIVVMHLGTNDIANNKQTLDIITAFSTLVDQMRASKPTMKILVAKIIPSSFNIQGTVNLNDAISPWALSKNMTTSVIMVVDQYIGFSTSDLIDGVHPNDSGDQKIANVWYQPLVNAINDSQNGC
ncbi:SGNH hydrolase-type esterase domain-containing protein [Lipomyces chichibuensis]|uniref:SGNH hydrolase-type esterase domain-containing protein n=1 Tax=Lipomyces chichibuensis TaxID=1546026 RepID=UPI0033434597